jgi:cell division control protein 6
MRCQWKHIVWEFTKVFRILLLHLVCFIESAYQEVRQALQGCAPTSLPGREVHLDKLHSFLQRHLRAGRSGTLYVSGPPGTGKTACLSKIMELPEV